MARRTAAICGLVLGLLAVPAAAQAAPPTDVRVTDLRASGATLTWKAPGGTIYGYKIIDLNAPETGNQVGYSFTTTGEAALQPRTSYRLAVQATFIVGSELVDSAPSAPVNVTTPADTTPPGAPDLRHTGHTATSVSLLWLSGGDDVGVETFVITNGERTVEVPAWQQWWTTVSGLETNRTHTFTVRARDAAGNVSPASNEVSVLIENVPPSPPGNLRRSGDQLVWDPSTDNSGTVTQYRIFVDGGPFPLAIRNAPPGPLQGLDGVTGEPFPPSGTTHTYTVRAVDPSGNLSAPSNAVTTVVP